MSVKRLRWKKSPRPSGLMSIGAGPRGSIYHDGTTEYATVYPLGGDWRGPLRGWYWTSSVGGKRINTCNAPAPDEETAKEQAQAFVKAELEGQT